MSREEAIAFFKDMNECTYGNLEAVEMAIQALSSWEEYSDKLWKEAYERGKTEALSQEPTVTSTDEPMTMVYPTIVCDDAISRDELLKAIDTWDKFGYTETGCFVREPKGDYVPYIHYDDVIKCIKGMPSVTQKYGKWIVDREVVDKSGKPIIYHFAIHCSECGFKYANTTNFCSNCGAKMVNPQESEDAV